MTLRHIAECWIISEGRWRVIAEDATAAAVLLMFSMGTHQQIVKLCVARFGWQLMFFTRQHLSL